MVINMRDVLSNLGYTAGTKPPARTMDIVDELLRKFRHLVEPAYACVTRDIEQVSGRSVYIAPDTVFQGRVISRLLKQSQKVAIFALTIGSRLEATTSRLSDEKLMVESAIVDAVGSAAAEGLADAVQGVVGEQAAAEGLAISRRFSPGYCDWPIIQQKQLFAALGEDTAGIRLSVGGLMIPQKSVSGIIGIGPEAVAEFNPCRTCKKKDCVGRRQ